MTLSFCFALPKRSSSCTHCSHKFQPLEIIFSSLRESKTEWLRSDLCQNCFKGIEEAGISRWTSQISHEDTKRKLTGWELLVDIVANQEEESRQEAYVLAMILQRQKVLIERKKEVKQEGETCTLYECRATGDLLLIPHADFTPDSLKDIQLRLEEKCRLKGI